MFLAHTVYGEGREVVIRGGMESNSMCVPDSKADKIWVVFAVDGSPEIAARVKKVFDECYPDKGLDADAAVKLQNAYDAELKFFVAPDSSATMPALKSYDESSQPVALTGTLYDKDGRHWIKVTKLEHIQLKYPEKMLAPDVPFVMPEKQPLVLTIAPNLTLKCIKIPAGKALLGAQFYMGRRYQEEYPRLVTLTKPYYMSEIPITQEIWEAIMGNNPSKQKGARLPVQNPLFPDVDTFCRILSQKTGHKVRLPSAAEWEYAARVGTSNPGFAQKYRDQNSGLPDNKTVLPVKQKKPNAWGLYDMASCWWEITCDKAMYPVRKAEIDPVYPAASNHENRCTMGYPKEDSGWTISMREFNDETGLGYSSNKFRIVVEVEGK
jgi:formylglycine-generating enzyme required for sulfatase activity